MNDFADFSKEISAWTDQTASILDRKWKGVITRLFSAVIQTTPVSDRIHKGRLRSNWKFSVGAPRQGYVQTTDPTGVKTTAKLSSFVKGLDISKDDMVFMTNNAPYAAKIEYDNHSQKAPGGMVRINVIRIGAIGKF